MRAIRSLVLAPVRAVSSTGTNASILIKDRGIRVSAIVRSALPGMSRPKPQSPTSHGQASTKAVFLPVSAIFVRFVPDIAVMPTLSVREIRSGGPVRRRVRVGERDGFRNEVMMMADAEGDGRGASDAVEPSLPVDQLKAAGQELLRAVTVRALRAVSGRVDGLTARLDAVTEGGPGIKAALTGTKELITGKSPAGAGLRAGIAGATGKVTDALGSDGSSGHGGSAKTVNIIEEFDVGLPRRTAYDRWSQFGDYPSFTRKVEAVEQTSDETMNWRAQIFLSHRNWESTIVEQVPDDRIVWRSTGTKGYVDGAVTFHELAPTMTRVLLVAEYHPGGFLEKTANLWRAQGRRLRSDFKHVKRHMMTSTIIEQNEVHGWRGEIRNSEVVKSHEDALSEEQQATVEQPGHHEDAGE